MLSEAVQIAIVTGVCTAVPLLAVQLVTLIIGLRNGRGIAEVKDGILSEKKKAQELQRVAENETARGMGAAARVEVERTDERKRATARVLQAGDAGREQGLAQGRAESGLMPLDPLGPELPENIPYRPRP